MESMQKKHCKSPKKTLGFSQLMNSITTENTQATMDVVRIKISINRSSRTTYPKVSATNGVPPQQLYSIFNKAIRLSFVCRFSIEFLLKQ